MWKVTWARNPLAKEAFFTPTSCSVLYNLADERGLWSLKFRVSQFIDGIPNLFISPHGENLATQGYWVIRKHKLVKGMFVGRGEEDKTLFQIHHITPGNIIRLQYFSKL